MRRNEIKEALVKSIEDHFPEDVAALFKYDRLNPVARWFQDVDKEDADDVADDMRRIAENTKDSTWDALVDGTSEWKGDPEGWLYAALRGRLDHGR